MDGLLEGAVSRRTATGTAGVQDTVTVHALPCGRLFGARTGPSPIFVLTGSFFTRPADEDEVLLQSLTTAMLLNGTCRRDALELAGVLEGCGASLSIDSDGRRVAFSVQACVEDLATVTEILAECLLQPRFEPGELALEQQRMMADLRYRALFPRAVAGDALMRTLYAPGDIRHRGDAESRIAAIERFDVGDLQRYHRQQFGTSMLQMVVVGGIEPDAVAELLCDRWAAWSVARAPAAEVEPSWILPPAAAPPQRFDVPGGRYAVVLGRRVSLRGGDPDHVALGLANRIFGGTFTSRLVRAVRDERGLSYGIDAALSRPDPRLDGHWRIELTASPDKVTEAAAVAREELARFVDEEVGCDELEACKVEAIGAFHVNLASLYGISETLLAGAELGQGSDHMRTYASQVEAVTVADLHRVIREHLHPEAIIEVVAGSDQ